MTASVSTTHEYIATVPEEIRQMLGQVAAAMRRALPGAEERIRYGILALMLGEGYALHDRPHARLTVECIAIASRPQSLATDTTCH